MDVSQELNIGEPVQVVGSNSRVKIGFNIQTEAEFFYVEIKDPNKQRKWHPLWNIDYMRNTWEEAEAMRQELISTGETFNLYSIKKEKLPYSKWYDEVVRLLVDKHGFGVVGAQSYAKSLSAGYYKEKYYSPKDAIQEELSYV